MARDGYLILDSDLHMMEPDDLWARYLEGLGDDDGRGDAALLEGDGVERTARRARPSITDGGDGGGAAPGEQVGVALGA